MQVIEIDELLKFKNRGEMDARGGGVLKTGHALINRLLQLGDGIPPPLLA